MRKCFPEGLPRQEERGPGVLSARLHWRLRALAKRPFSHKAFAEKMGGINFPMLSDFYPHGAVCSLYDCLRPQGYPKRAVFIIDKPGVIRFAKEYDKGIPENTELLGKLDKINKG